MNRRMDFSQLDGLGFTQDTLDFMQTSYRTGIGALASAFGNKVILSGLVESGGFLTDGWVVIDGEVLPFVGGSINTNIITTEIGEIEQFSDQSVKTVYYTKFAQPAVTGGYPYADFKRLDTVINIFVSLKQLITDFTGHRHHWVDIIDPPTIPDQLIIKRGSFMFGDAPGADGLFNVAFADIGTDQYIVTGSLLSMGAQWNNDNDVFWMARAKTSAGFQLLTREVSAAAQSLRFEYALIKL